MIMVRRVLVLLTGLMILLLAGCSLGPQDAPQPIRAVPTPIAPQPPTAGNQATRPVIIYLVRDAHLVAAHRTVPADGGIDAVLAALGDGPTATETANGLGTALPPSRNPLRAGIDNGVADITVPTGFSQLGLTQQVTAMGQLVYSVTEIQGVQSVQFTNRHRIDIPVSGGALVSGPVDRSDFWSIAPL